MIEEDLIPEVPYPDNVLEFALPGTELVIVFGAMALGTLDHENKYEFLKVTGSYECSRLFYRDPNGVWYHTGTDGPEGEINSILKIRDDMLQRIERLRPTKITTVGVSSGGFAAILFGHMIGADKVHAFGPQTFLSESLRFAYSHPQQQWGEQTDRLHDLNLPTELQFFDLRPVLLQDNSKTSFTIHLCVRHETDNKHFNHIRTCFGVAACFYDCDDHSPAAWLRGQGRLLNVLDS